LLFIDWNYREKKEELLALWINTIIVFVNNIEYTYESKSHKPNDDDIAMVDVTVDWIPRKTLIDSCSNLNIIKK